MSRRKQSNPKPLKRKSEDVLEEVAELHHLPLHILALHDPEDEAQEYTVFTKVSLREGFLFGPYSGNQILDTDEDAAENSVNVIQATDARGNEVRIRLRDETGGWLKLLRHATLHDEANVSLTLDGSEIWCTVINRIEQNSELLMTCQVLDNSASRSSQSPHSHESPRHHDVVFNNAENAASLSSSADASSNLAEKNDGAACTAANTSHSSVDKTGTPIRNEVLQKTAAANSAKYEPSSPSSPQCATSPPSGPASDPFHASSACATSVLAHVPYLNGLRHTGYVNCSLNAETSSDECYQCNACEIKYSNPRTLQVHQLYYCPQKVHAATSDTDTDDATRSVKEDALDAPRSTGSPLDFKRTNAKDIVSSTSQASAEAREQSEGDTTDKSLPVVPANCGSSRSRIFRCPYCKYASDKKASVTRHIRMHGTSPTTDPSVDFPISIPPLARYCANCDIQFASYKNYQVHKQYYCSTRHVHKSSTSGMTNQQPSSQPNSGPVDKSGEATAQDGGPNSCGMMLNQPLYAAISTSPLILVPCSYVAGGGLTQAAGLIPSGSIIIPNASPEASSGSESNSEGPSVIPTYTVMPGSSAPLSAPQDSADTKSCSPDSFAAKKNVPDTTEQKSPSAATNVHKDDAEKPLDLSFPKKPRHGTRQATESSDASQPARNIDVPRPAASASSTSLGSEETVHTPTPLPIPIPTPSNVPVDFSAVAKSLPLPPAPIPPAMLLDPRNSCIPPIPIQTPPQVLVKQGTSKCKECNIVFYKHENYLVHKSLYCASRAQKAKTAPQDVLKHAVSEESIPRDEAGQQNSNSRSPVITEPDVPDPGESSTENTSASPTGQGSVLQFYCMACGIKFTSMDNLNAHQTYYCPKRETVVGQPIAVVPTTVRGEYRCSKCKNSYPTEDSLKNHPCALQRKCPYCDVYCPTLSAAQRHLVTHTGVKSFRCSLCGYKGHTLRGMRTHIRIHLDKNSTTPEEAYILCVDEGGTEIGSVKKNTRNLPAADRLGLVPDPTHADPMAAALSPSLQTGLHLTETVPRKGVPDLVSDQVLSGDVTHWCQICGYSSSYKGNVVRHVKLVHKELVATQSMSSIVNSKTSAVTTVGKQGGESFEAPDTGKGKPSIEMLDVSRTVMNGAGATVEAANKDENELPIVPVKSESLSPPAVTGNGRGVKRPLSGEGQPLTPSGSVPGANKSGPKYCKSCDISFNYLSNFIAHKKFYCTPRPGDSPAQETGLVQSVQ